MPQTLVFPGGRVDVEDGALEDDASFERAARRECMEEAAIDLGGRALHWFDTWLTPSVEPRRYLARFFIARLEPGEGTRARADGRETTEATWASATEFLARWRRSEVDLPPPTLSILLRMARGDWQALLHRDAAEVRDAILPKVAPKGDTLRILMPHHPEYVDAPGEGGSRPARVDEFPLGFWREERRWRPWLTGDDLSCT